MTVWTRSDELAVVDDGERIVAIVLDRLDDLGPRVFTGTAAAILRAVGSSSNEDAVIETVVQTFDVPTAKAEPQIRRFLQDLETQGFVHSQSE